MKFVKRKEIGEELKKVPDHIQGELDEYLALESDLKIRSRPPELYRPFFEKLRPILRDTFEKRCGYCESVVGEANNVGINLFRPVQNAENAKGKTSFLHYMWLAYEWENLIYSCAVFAATKANQFPIAGHRSH